MRDSLCRLYRMGASMEATQRRAVEDELPALLEVVRPELRRVLGHFRIPPDDAEDLVQTALLLTVARWGEIQDPRAWIVGTLRMRCIIYWRDRERGKGRYVTLEEWDPRFAVD